MFSKLAKPVVLGTVCLMLGGMLAPQVQAEDKGAEQTIRVGTGGAYKPWCFKENNELQGFEVDVWNEIGKRAGYKIEFTLSKFSGLVGLMDAGKTDTVAHQMSINPQREAKYHFSAPYAYSKYDFTVKDGSSYHKIEDLKGKKVGAWLGGNGEKTLRELNAAYSLDLKMSFYDGTPLEKEVEIGRLDACWQGAIKSQTVIDLGDLPCHLMGAKTDIGSEINAYPFVKTDAGKKMSEEVTKVLADMRADGTLKNLSEKWFKLDTTQK